MPNSEHTPSFEELSIMREQGLLPVDGDYTESMTMAEVKKINETTETKKELFKFAKGKSPTQLERDGEILEFGKLLGRFQRTMETTLSGEQESPLVVMMETSRIFNDLGWYDESYDEIGTALDLATNLGEETESLFALLGESILLDSKNKNIFANWADQFGDHLSPADFASEIVEVGMSQASEEMSFHEQVELGILIISTSIDS